MLKSRGEGDSTFSVFSRASDGVRAAYGAQVALSGYAWPEGAHLRVRVAVHTGEAVETDGDYVGTTVNRAARLRTVAEGGEVIVSSATAQLAVDHLPLDTSLKALGPIRLRDLERAEDACVLVGPGLVESGRGARGDATVDVLAEAGVTRREPRRAGCDRRAAHERRDRRASVGVGTHCREPCLGLAPQAGCGQPVGTRLDREQRAVDSESAAASDAHDERAALQVRGAPSAARSTASVLGPRRERPDCARPGDRRSGDRQDQGRRRARGRSSPGAAARCSWVHQRTAPRWPTSRSSTRCQISSRPRPRVSSEATCPATCTRCRACSPAR